MPRQLARRARGRAALERPGRGGRGRRRTTASRAGTPYIDLARRFDPLKVAVEYGRKIGATSMPWCASPISTARRTRTSGTTIPSSAPRCSPRKKDPKTGARIPVQALQAHAVFARAELCVSRGAHVLRQLLQAARLDRHEGHPDRPAAASADRRLRADRQPRRSRRSTARTWRRWTSTSDPQVQEHLLGVLPRCSSSSCARRSATTSRSPCAAPARKRSACAARSGSRPG